jgi:hypothetical protein
MIRRWSANVMTSGRQGVLVIHDKSTSGRQAVGLYRVGRAAMH